MNKLPRDALLSRRRLLQTLTAAGGACLSGCVAPALSGKAASGGDEAVRIGQHDPARFLAPLRASTDRIFDITVCLRPFRAAGPRLETERIRDTLVVHNYGHGGSGWSLSWGSSTV